MGCQISDDSHLVYEIKYHLLSTSCIPHSHSFKAVADAEKTSDDIDSCHIYQIEVLMVNYYLCLKHLLA